MDVQIIVANKRNGAQGEYVGRCRGSVLGNPFVLGRDGDRDEVIGKYRTWLRWRIAARDTRVCGELDRLAVIARTNGTLTLVCFCAPLPCHADVIRGVLLEMVAHPARSRAE